MLNERQKEAVEHTEGPLLILAGAGAGKTKTLVERIINIIKKGTEPRRILAITFTNKAAKEMRERILSRMKELGMIEDYLNFSVMQAQTPMIKTFHSLGMYILQEEYIKADLTRRLTIYDESDCVSSIRDILERENIDPKMHEPRRVKAAISRLKNDLVEMDTYKQNAFSPFQKVVARVWPIYENFLKEKKVVDFDDLILKTLRLLEENKDLREKYQNKWNYIHVDEYQDTNNSQYLLCKILTGSKKNICAVGDVDQNIYSWRGANLKNLLRFEEDFSGDTVPKIILLEQNYRSTKNIINAANEVIKKNKIRKEKKLFTENEEGEVITVYTGYDDRQEAKYIATKIKDLIEEMNVNPSEICVLYRTNFQSRVIEQALLAENIKYHLLGVRFFDRKEVRDVMSYLKLSMNGESVEDLKRAISNPTRGFGKVAMTKILSGRLEDLPKAQAEKYKSFLSFIDELSEMSSTSYPSEIILKIIKGSGIETDLKEKGGEEEMERLGNIYELLTLATEYDSLPQEEAMDKFLEESALVSDQDTDTKEEDKIKLMTIHASKGLEFHYVFIAGLEEDLFPSRRFDAKPSQEESEEERRLFYVALTRARKKLFLSNAKNRILYGKRQMQFRSEFLDDIPEELRLEEEEYFDDVGDGNEKIVVYL